MQHRVLHSAALLVLILTSTFAQGDLLAMRDGRQIEGRILSETSSKVVIETKIANIKTTQTISKRDISEVTYTPLADDFWETKRSPSSKGSDADETDDDSVGPGAADEPANDNGDEPETSDRVYFGVVPIKGGIGSEVNAHGLRQALSNISKKRIEHAVFVIDSPGGYIYSAIEMMDILKEFDDKLTYHAVIEEGAISAASIFAACSDNIFVRPGATLGGAVVYSNDQTTGNSQVDAKLNSIWAAGVASRAEAKGHSGELFRAMAVLEVQLWQSPDGEITSVHTSGAEQIDTASTILTIRGAQLVRAGMATEVTGDLESIGEHLGIENFTERRRVADRAMTLAGSRVTKLEERWVQADRIYTAAVEELNNSDPLRQDDYQIARRTGLNNEQLYGFRGDSATKWSKRTKESIRQCELILDALREFAKISKSAESLDALHLVVDEDEGTVLFRDTERRLQRLRDQFDSPPWRQLLG